jgi:hypothetical protein
MPWGFVQRLTVTSQLATVDIKREAVEADCVREFPRCSPVFLPTCALGAWPAASTRAAECDADSTCGSLVRQTR